ncbi:MAG TPA: helix-turn-helix transcriptional regulator [Candidatus Dormibacteraeota bacterium]|nr:helix-turn-helix transcriptional regulator [Candidatus Dormibacteraeota bacterium]
MAKKAKSGAARSYRSLIESTTDLFLSGEAERVQRLERALGEKRGAATPSDKKLLHWIGPAALKKRREDVGLSQQELAQIAGITRSVIANYETGVTFPSLDNAMRMYQVFEALGSKEAREIFLSIAKWDNDISRATLRLFDEEALVLETRRRKVEERLAQVEAMMAKRLGAKGESNG